MEPCLGTLAGARLAIIFVSYNSSRDLSRALGSLARTVPRGAVQVVVVENGSEVGATRVVCERLGARLVVPGRNLGYGRAANHAAAGLTSEYLAVANPDIVFQPDTVRLLLEFMGRHPDAGVVAPQFMYPDGSAQPSARRRPSFRYVLAGRRSPLARLRRPGRRAREFQYLGSETGREPLLVDAVMGTLMLFRRSAFESVGGFDRDYFMFAEDIDICLRLSKRWGVYLLPAARLVHRVGSARRGARPFTEFHRLRSLRRLLRRGYGRALWPVIDILFAGYLVLVMTAGAFGLGEYEYTWSARAERR